MADTVEQAAPEIMADVPMAPKREKGIKTLMDKYPGHISWASDRANFSGCRIVTFTENNALGLEKEDAEVFQKQLTELEDAHPDDFLTAETIANLYFSTRGNLLVVDTKVTSMGITMLITTQLDADDLEELQETQTRINLEMREWREEREKRKLAEMEAFKEEKRLADVGRKAEQYGWVKRIRELEEKLAAKGN